MTMTATPTAFAPAAAPVAAPAAPAAPSTPSTATEPIARPSLEQRASAAKERLESAPSESAGEPSGPSTSSDQGASTADPGNAPAKPPPADDARSAAAKERLERIERMRAKERAADEERQAKRQTKERDGEFEKLRSRLAELEPLNQTFASEEALLTEAERRGMTAEKLVAWMRTRISDPAAVAERQVKSEADKLREEIKAEREARTKLEERIANERTQLEAQRAAETKTTTFISEAKAAAATHPFTAKLHAKYGDGGLIAFANQFIAPLLPEGYATSELHDHVEQLLTEIVDAVGGASPTHDAPANGTSRPPTKNGADQPVTLSNGLTSERASVVEEIPLHRLSLDERTRRLKEQLARE
jgi:hypothetical protein